jgi:abhydrolase domain-containing protein 1/3
MTNIHFAFLSREILKLPDGGQLALDWENYGNTRSNLVMLVLPGLTSTSKSSYVTHFVDKAKSRGCATCVMNYRGVELTVTTPRLYCASDHDDLKFVLGHLKKLYPQHLIFAVGVSIGKFSRCL